MHEITNYVHAGFGSLALLGGIVALVAIKGSALHIRGGKVFAWLMLMVVATTAIIMFYRFLPLAIVLALATAYLIPSGLLSFNTDVKGFVALNVLLMAIVGALCAFTLLQFVRVNLGGDQLFVGPLILGLMFGWLFVGDWRMLIRRPAHPNFWIRRHLVRMILAFTIAVMALVRIGTAFGLPFELSVILPLGLAGIAILIVYRRYPVPGRVSPAATTAEPV